MQLPLALLVTLAAQLDDGAPPPAEPAIQASETASVDAVDDADATADPTTAQPPAAETFTPENASLARDCAALFGGDLTREERRASREARLEEVSRSERLLDVFHSDAAWQVPKPMRVPGIDVIAIEDGPDGEPSARVRIAESWSGTCPAGDYLVARDDGLGSEGLVLALLDEGVLAEHRGELIFLPKSGMHPPTFRMIWRSGFALNITPGSNAAIGGSSGSSPKRNSTKRAPAADRNDRKQRAKANAKAASENRRNMATRPVRPRG